MQWTFNGKPVEPVEWQWVAVYSDNTTLKQYDDSGYFHQFKEIDQGRLVVFKMVSPLHSHVYTLLFEPGMKLIHYYENYRMRVGTPQEVRFRVYCFGYERGKEKVITLITPNGEAITTNKRKE